MKNIFHLIARIKPLVQKQHKLLVCLALTLSSITASAQVDIIKNTVDKLNSLQSLAYASVSYQRDHSAATMVTRQTAIYVKAPDDKMFGYRFKLLHDQVTETYNGQHIVTINTKDSTYRIDDARQSAFNGSMFDRVGWISSFASKKPANVSLVADTTLDSILCTHLVLNTRDTMVGKEHFYTRIHLLIDKSLGVPASIIYKSRNADIGDAIVDSYSEVVYLGYRFNKDNIRAGDVTIPNGFHPPKVDVKKDLLMAGTTAPDWKVMDAKGKQLSLAQLKGKVILVDHFFVGCYPCMMAIKPLNAMHEKYQYQNVAILSITGRDNTITAAEYRKRYNVKYPIYTNGAGMERAYHVKGFPTFYVIDQQGKIAGTILGYEDDFETRATAMIDGLLKNK